MEMSEIAAFRIAYQLYCSEYEYVGSEQSGSEFDEFVRGLRASAWDEGFADGWTQADAYTNPYREEQ